MSQRNRESLVSILQVGLYLAGLFFTARMLNTVVHELGHGLASLLTGGQFDAISIAPFDASYAFISGSYSVLVTLGGVLLAWIVGWLTLITCWWLTQKQIVRSWPLTFLVLFGLTGAAIGPLKLPVGVLIEWGDAARLVYVHRWPPLAVIVGGLVLGIGAAVPAFALLAREIGVYVRLNNPWNVMKLWVVIGLPPALPTIVFFPDALTQPDTFGLTTLALLSIAQAAIASLRGRELKSEVYPLGWLPGVLSLCQAAILAGVLSIVPQWKL